MSEDIGLALAHDWEAMFFYLGNSTVQLILTDPPYGETGNW